MRLSETKSVISLPAHLAQTESCLFLSSTYMADGHIQSYLFGNLFVEILSHESGFLRIWAMQLLTDNYLICMSMNFHRKLVLGM